MLNRIPPGVNLNKQTNQRKIQEDDYEVKIKSHFDAVTKLIIQIWKDKRPKLSKY